MDSLLTSCCVCLENPPHEDLTNVDDYIVCQDCIRQLFQRALEYEGNWPPKWAKHTLDIQTYTQQRIFTQDFLNVYHQKERECCCPPANRIYCSWSPHRRD